MTLRMKTVMGAEPGLNRPKRRPPENRRSQSNETRQIQCEGDPNNCNECEHSMQAGDRVKCLMLLYQKRSDQRDGGKPFQ